MIAKINGKIFALVALCFCMLAATAFGLSDTTKTANAAGAEITAEITAGARAAGRIITPLTWVKRSIKNL